MDCGELRERISILGVVETDGNFALEVRQRSFAKAAPSDKNLIYSKVGVGARRVDFTVRHRKDLSEKDMILWNGKNCLISDILPENRLYYKVCCAVVPVSQCECCDVRFPAVLTEKYVRHEELEPYAMNVSTYVLVTPKAVYLQRGALVTVDSVVYEILTGHELEENRNEYEVQRTADL